MFFFLLVLLPVAARAEDVYHIRPLSERELLRTYERVITDACRYSDDQWHVSTFDPNAGHWGTGISGGNEGIRAICEMVLACGALLKYSHLGDADRRDFMAKTTAALRYVTATHLTGTQNCTDDKHWGGDWQSAMWTGTLAFGAWLIWDDLDPELQKGVERVVASEADRFLATRPPGGRWNDTKAEENGWTLICISAATNMFPDHPRASAWHEKAIEYMMNTLSVPKDLRDETMVDGRPAREWITSPNLHPDFTLENHGFFHPAYTECSSYFLTQAAMHYTYARRPVPQAATYHLAGTWQLLRSIMLPCGESAFPQGMDWEQHGLPNINLLASFGTYMRDPFASGMERIVLQRIRTWQEMQDGNLAVPGSRLGFTRHAIVAEQSTYGYLAHKIFGPSVPPGSIAEPPVVQRHSSVGFILHRTGSKLFTFSWKYRIMGMLAPIGEGHQGNPHFTVPITNGLVGGIELSPNDAKMKVVENSTKQTRTGFETNAVLLTNGDRLKQTLRVTSLGEKAVIYQDSVTALSDVTMAKELGVPFGIENDELSGGTRTIHHQDGETIFDWTKPQQPVAIPGSWANVEGRLGVVSVAGSGMTYIQAAGYNAQAVCADILYGSFSDEPKTFKAGDQVARRIAVLFVEVTPEKTAALARSIRIEGKVLRVALPEGGEAEIPLLD